MTILESLEIFRANEDGAVTVDWVVLTAAVVGLGMAVLGSVYDGTEAASGKIETHLEKDHIKTDFES